MIITNERAYARPSSLSADAIDTVRRWLEESATVAPDASAARLAGVLRDPDGLDFTIGFVDRVVRPEDLRVAARNLDALARKVPAFLPWYMRVAVQLGGGFAPLLPWPIVPIARAVLRRMVGHLILDATPARLDKSMEQLRSHGIRLNLNLLGEAVLGDDEADRRLEGTRALLARDDVDYVSIKVSSVASQLSLWSFEETVERLAERLAPLYRLAANSAVPKFINLDMEEYRDLDLTLAVFTRILDAPELRDLEAGIVLQAYLPDALGALQNLTGWAIARRASGGAGIKVRVVKGANLAMEHVDAELHDWPLATYGTKQDTDANYKRVLDFALRAPHTDAVRIGVAGHNLFDIAFAWLLATHRGVADRIEFEMLLGMATGQADAVRRDVGGLLLYTPVVRPTEFDSAISYLIRRLEENASPENFMSGVFELASSPKVFEREATRFVASLEALDEAERAGLGPTPNRVQDRREQTSREQDRRDQDRRSRGTTVEEMSEPATTRSATDHPARAPFRNTADTDPSTAANRAWGRDILARVPHSRAGVELVRQSAVTDAAALDAIIADAVAAGTAWAERTAQERSALLHRAGDALEHSRAELIEVMASETGKTIAEGDVEVSEAIDFAHYYAERGEELDALDAAEFEPSRVIVVTPPWNFPVAIPAGGVLAALASGSAVIIKPAPQARRSAAVMVQALWDAGIPREVLLLVDLEEGALGRQLVAHPSVDRVILTGSWETAALFRSWRHDLPLLAETSGKNAIIVTPSADLDLAAADVVRSAFGHAGQKCSAASLVILVGSASRSQRFRRQLADAVRTLRVGSAADASTQVGPVIEPVAGKLKRALTELASGEKWLVEPRRLDDSGRLWSPGVRDGVAAGSEFHLTEYFGPVLGIMHADTLEDAIALQNAPEYGLTAGIHSLDPDEISLWLATVEAGNLYVNRGTTGAIVRRQPFGGWKRSTVGTSAKAGGPNYLLTLGGVSPVFLEPSQSLALTEMSPGAAKVIQAAQGGLEFLEFDRVRAAAQSDERAWSSEFGIARDVSALHVERNVFRYRSVVATVRLAEGASIAQLVRVLLAATRARARVTVSSALPLPFGLAALLRSPGSPLAVTELRVESDDAFLDSLASAAGPRPTRIRLIGDREGAAATRIAHAVEGSPDVAIYAQPVTTEGRIELLPFLREQSISITAHRFGNPDPSSAVVLPEDLR